MDDYCSIPCCFRRQVSKDDSKCSRKPTQTAQRGSPARMKRDEDDVKKVFEVISNWRNPFEPSEELFSLSSGYVVSESMKADLLLAKRRAQQL